MPLVLGPANQDLYHRPPGSRAFGLGLRLLGPLGLKPLDLDYTTSLPGPPACGQQSVELLGLHNRMGQYRVVNIFLRLVYMLLLLFLWGTLMQTQRVNVLASWAVWPLPQIHSPAAVAPKQPYTRSKQWP